MAAVVENLSKRREPLPTLSGVYFITPSETSLNELMADYKTKALYKTTHVFFSTRIDPRLLAAFRSQAPPALLSNLRTLKEVSQQPTRLGIAAEEDLVPASCCDCQACKHDWAQHAWLCKELYIACSH